MLLKEHVNYPLSATGVTAALKSMSTVLRVRLKLQLGLLMLFSVRESLEMA